MEINNKIALWEQILSSTYFVDKNMQNAFPIEISNPRRTVFSVNKNSVELSESKTVPYSYEARVIHSGDKNRTRKTILCVTEMKSNGVKNEYHIFYAYRRNSYFIGEFIASKNEIVLVGIAEPRAEKKLYENQEKLEDSFRASINIASKYKLRWTAMN